MAQTRTSVAVFCGSSVGVMPVYADAARAVGRELARRSATLVFGGGGVGLMKEVADGCLEGDGRVIGVIPRALVSRELAHAGVKDMRVVETMHERKQLMSDLAQAFVALPGGFGTLDETFEILTWAQLGIHKKPIALLDVAGFYRPLIAALDVMTVTGFTKPEHRGLLHVAVTPAAVVEHALTGDVPDVGASWVTSAER